MGTPYDTIHEIEALKIKVASLEQQVALISRFADKLADSVVKLIGITQEIVGDVQFKKDSTEDTVV